MHMAKSSVLEWLANRYKVTQAAGLRARVSSSSDNADERALQDACTVEQHRTPPKCLSNNRSMFL
eukprot:1152015-Pelagomonas_calceolata.AAC.9